MLDFICISIACSLIDRLSFAMDARTLMNQLVSICDFCVAFVCDSFFLSIFFLIPCPNILFDVEFLCFCSISVETSEKNVQ